MRLAPVAVFTYNRPEHIKKTINALLQNRLAGESEVFIYSDGGRNKKDWIKVNKERDYLDTVKGFKKINLIKQNKNFGLAKSIVEGASELTDRFGRVIVLEDDIVTSPFFLSYMNEALDLYQDEERVMHIAGYFPPVKARGLPVTFFYNQANCWGWATWKRAWRFYNDDAEYLYNKIKELDRIKEFNLDGVRPQFEQQLLDNISGKIKTWAIKWQASVFLQNGLCLHPRQSLVRNIGFDGSGDNCRVDSRYRVDLPDKKISPQKQPLRESKQARAAVKKFYKSLDPNIWQKLKLKLRYG